MGFRDDERGQPVLIGFILLFGILVLAFAGYQAFVVPSQNAEVEFSHSQEVQTDMQDLRNSLLDVRSVKDGEIISEHRPVRVQLGTQYPARLIALNPPPVSGSLTTEQPDEDVSFTNAEVVGSYEGNPQGELLDTDHNTRLLTYSPDYSEYQQPPDTVLEHSLLYNDFEDATLPVRDQRLIQGERNRIQIVLFGGDVSHSGSGAVTLDPETLDGPTAPVRIAADDDDPIELTIPTQEPDTWIELIGTTYADGEENARITQSGTDNVVIELDPDEEYTLRMARVGFDGGAEDDSFTQIQPPNTDDSGDNTFNTRWVEADVNDGGTTITDPETVTVEPGDAVVLTANVDGRESTLSVDGALGDYAFAYDVENEGDYTFSEDQRSIEDGEDSIEFDIPDEAVSGDEFEVYVTAGDDSDVLTVQVEDDDDEGDETMADRTELTNGESFNGNSEIRFDIDNTGTEDIILTDITVDSDSADFIENQEGGDTFRTEGGDTLFEDRIDIGQQESINDLTIGDGNEETVELGQFRTGDGNQGTENMNNEEITITIEFDDGSTGTYTVST